MKRVTEYNINEETMVILNQYDENGKLCSLVIEEEEIYEVKASPLSIIEESIKYYGGSLGGAILGAKGALGKISMPPVKISGGLGIYWFPSKSSEHDDCVWFSVDHIRNYESLSDKVLKVYFHNGYSITIDSTHKRFDRRVNLAHKYKNIMEKRVDGKRPHVTKSFNIIKDAVRNHYRVDEQGGC